MSLAVAPSLSHLFAQQDHLLEGMVALELNKEEWLELGVDPEVDDNKKNHPNSAFMAHVKETYVTELYKTVLEDMFTQFMVSYQSL